LAGYRRFIAYVYDYESGKKGSNCGFIKVEVKDQQCSVEIHLHCPGLPGLRHLREIKITINRRNAGFFMSNFIYFYVVRSCILSLYVI